MNNGAAVFDIFDKNPSRRVTIDNIIRSPFPNNAERQAGNNVGLPLSAVHFLRFFIFSPFLR